MYKIVDKNLRTNAAKFYTAKDANADLAFNCPKGKEVPVLDYCVKHATSLPKQLVVDEITTIWQDGETVFFVLQYTPEKKA